MALTSKQHGSPSPCSVCCAPIPCSSLAQANTTPRQNGAGLLSTSLPSAAPVAVATPTRPPLAAVFGAPSLAPIGKPQLPPMLSPPRMPPLPDVKGMRCLVVDDEPSNRRLCARMLQRLECKSLALTDGDSDEVRLLLPVARICLFCYLVLLAVAL